MNLNQWLDAETGRSARLAEHFNVTPSAVTQWRTNGVPVDRMKAVRDFASNAVTVEEMLPIEGDPEALATEEKAATEAAAPQDVVSVSTPRRQNGRRVESKA